MQTHTPSVLAVLVVKDGAPWLKRALASLARQTHARLGVIGVDNGSTDGSDEVLRSTLGPRRVIRLEENVGFAAAVARALETPAAGDADYVLLLHDDTVLATDAVARLVETAGRVDGAGVVAPKTLDWDRPDVLLDIGATTDRFGYPYSPLEEGEIDQGQYDSIREVLFVSSTAMLVARDVWRRAGLPDERLRSGQADLDFCWRARLAGFRVLVNPAAVALHRLAGDRMERPEDGAAPSRYLAERSGLLSVMKNYRLITLLWVLPLYAVQATARAVLYLVTRNFDRAFQVIRAWGWNLLHLPGTVRRRFRAQASRRVSDREIAAFMAPAGARLQRWAQQASALFVTRHERPMEDEEEPEAPPLPRRAVLLATQHPVAVALVLAVLLSLVSFRDVVFTPGIEGGLLPVFPEGPAAFLREFAAGWRSTGFGGTGGPSPALVPLGVGSAITLADPGLLARLLVSLTPLLAGVACYRAVRRLTGHPGAGVVAAAAYGLSGITMWTASNGAIGPMAALLSLPWLVGRVGTAFDGRAPARPLRWVVGTGLVLALAVAFFPAIWLAVVVVAAPMLLASGRRGSRARGVGLSLASAGVAAVLIFPFALELVRAGGGTGVASLGRADFWALLGTSPGPSPGSWAAALFLPIGAVLAFPFIGGDGRLWAGRSLLAAGVAVPLAWLAAAGQLPPLLSNPIAYLVAGAFSMSVLIGLAVPWVLPRARRTAFGMRQLVVGLLMGALVLGLGGQVLQASIGSWAVGPDRVPPAWPVVASADPGEPFRVLWLGTPDGTAFPPPGGEPHGVVEAGPASVAYTVTGRGGRSILAIGLPASGPGYEAVREAVGAILSGDVRHGGALLAPTGVRYVVASADSFPGAASARLDDQLDLDLIQRAGGLRIYHNAHALPAASSMSGERARRAVRSPRVLATVALDPARALPLQPAGGPGWSGRVEDDEGGVVVLAQEFDEDWRLETPSGSDAAPFRAFGWAVGFEAAVGDVEVRFGGQATRTFQVVALAVLWAVALWIGGRRVRDDRRATAAHRARLSGTEVEAPELAPAQRAPGARR